MAVLRDRRAGIHGQPEPDLRILNYGNSRVWVDDGSFEAVGVAAQAGPRALSDPGLSNVTAFAKVLGYVRHFHPSDQVTKVDWDAFSA